MRTARCSQTAASGMGLCPADAPGPDAWWCSCGRGGGGSCGAAAAAPGACPGAALENAGCAAAGGCPLEKAGGSGPGGCALAYAAGAETGACGLVNAGPGGCAAAEGPAAWGRRRGSGSSEEEEEACCSCWAALGSAQAATRVGSRACSRAGLEMALRWLVVASCRQLRLPEALTFMRSAAAGAGSRPRSVHELHANTLLHGQQRQERTWHRAGCP